MAFRDTLGKSTEEMAESARFWIRRADEDYKKGRISGEECGLRKQAAQAAINLWNQQFECAMEAQRLHTKCMELGEEAREKLNRAYPVDQQRLS